MSALPTNLKITFSYNWNHKLENDFYTTIRLSWPDHYKIGETFDVMLNGKLIHKAKIIDVKRLQLSQLTEWHSRLDSGQSVQELREMLTRMHSAKVNGKIDKALFDWILLQRLQN